MLEGDAGTGKTVLLSDLFYKICNKLSKIKNQLRQYSYDSVEEENEEDSDYEYKQFSTINNRKTACIIVNHKEQVNVYNQIATKLRLQKNNDELVMLPSQFINRFSEQTEQGRGIIDRPKRCCDVALIDEAHLLNTQANQAYSGSNMLSDILCRSRVVIAAFDPNQILQSNQRWNSEDLEKLLGTYCKDKKSFGNSANDCGALSLNDSISVNVRRFILENQMRMRANKNVLEWIKNFIYNGCIGTLPVCSNSEIKNADSNNADKPFDFKVFDSPIKLFKAIKSKSEEKASGCDGHGLSRIVATYDWEYKNNKNNPTAVNGTWNVDLHCDSNGQWYMGLGEYADASSSELEILEREGKIFSHPWNYQLSSLDSSKHSHSIKETKKSWAEQPHTINEIGSTFTVQGFDLNYAGVIIGPSVQYRNGKVVFCPENSRNDKATNKRHTKDLSAKKKITLDYSIDNLKNELNVLLKRGVNGLYIFAVDTELEKALLDAQRNSFI